MSCCVSRYTDVRGIRATSPWPHFQQTLSSTIETIVVMATESILIYFFDITRLLRGSIRLKTLNEKGLLRNRMLKFHYCGTSKAPWSFFAINVRKYFSIVGGSASFPRWFSFVFFLCRKQSRYSLTFYPFSQCL